MVVFVMMANLLCGVSVVLRGQVRPVVRQSLLWSGACPGQTRIAPKSAWMRALSMLLTRCAALAGKYAYRFGVS